MKDKLNRTPIEIALGIDENGMTTAKKLYDYLEMDKSHYSRWVKSNITENQFAEESADYWALATDGERDFNPNPTQDFKLAAIAESSGFQYIGSMQDRHRAVRTESYDRLNRKRPCRLDQRLDRAKGEAAREGATKTQIKDITKLTVIEGDKDFKPVYEAVIREMLVVDKVNI